MDYNIKTSCQECLFATYKDKTQIGCLADRLSYFETVECYNEQGEFFAILNYPCNLYRTAKWAENKSGDLLNIAKKEIQFNYTIITSSEDFEKKAELLDNQSIQPTMIYCYITNNYIPAIRRSNIEYVNFVADVKDPVHRIISRIKKATNIFFLEESNSIDDSFIDNLNYMLNTGMSKKTIFFSKKDNSFIMPSVYYRVYPTYTYKKILEELSTSLPETVGYFEEI